MSKKNRNHNLTQQEQEVQDLVEEQQVAESYEEDTEEVVEDVQEAPVEAQEAQEEVVEEEQEETPATSNTGTMDSVVELDSFTKEVKEVPVSGDAYHDSFVRSEVDRRAEERLRLLR